MSWVTLFNDIKLEVQTKMLPTKGKIVYEYNPFRNYRLSQNMFEYQGQLYSLGDLWKNFKISMYCSCKTTGTSIKTYTITESTSKTAQVAQQFGKIIEDVYKEGNNINRKNFEKALTDAKINNGWYNVPTTETDPQLRESGELVDFITDQFKFSLNNPVHIVPQYSYDGSVNLIINDGINVPRLINSRFSATGKNTYEIIDRKGNNDTNIYDQGEQFDIDTSLYKRVIKIPKIDFRGVTAGGNLKVGNYHFYFKLSDADGNETDFVGESGLVSVFIGFNDPFSVTTGQKNENSFKQVNFQLTNIDSSYDYVTVYYSRSTAEGLDNQVLEYCKIDKKFPVNNASIANIIITGFENITEITASDINLNYNIVDSVHTSAVCQNMLFLGNVHKPDIPYKELTDLSLRFLPYLKQEEYEIDIDHNYNISTSNKGYIDPKFIYDKTGYWGNEIYRFGIVYILNNGELSPVFNIRGNYNIKEFASDTSYKYIDSQYTRIPVWEDDQRNYINYHEEKYTILKDNKTTSLYENVKGVVTFNPTKDTNTIYSVDIRVDDDTIQELKKLVRGYFFVRQTRIPTILAQGITIGIDKESHTPTIPTADGFLTDLSESLNKTHVTTEDINDVNFISEGFLSRYSFKFEKKSSGLFGSILKGVASIFAKKKLDGRNTKAPAGYKIVETEDSRKIDQDFLNRFIPKDISSNIVAGIICPDYSLNQPYYNQIFTGNNHLIELTNSQNINCLNGHSMNYFTNDERHFYVPSYYDRNIYNGSLFKIIGVPDNTKCVGISDMLFRSRAGEAEEAWRYECIAEDYKSDKSKNGSEEDEETISNKKINTDIIRGSFGPYLAFNDNSNKFQPAETVNIYIPEYSRANMEEYFYLRMVDSSNFSAITDRFDLQDIDEKLITPLSNIVNSQDRSCGYQINAYRGDCYLCQFTHRVIRNFNDPSAPYNDEIVDVNTWKDNYDPNDTEKYEQINLGDVNAVQLGMWITFKLRSSNNLNIRTLDGSNVDESVMVGHPKGYYPYQPMSVEGSYKHSESQIYNKGFSKSLSERWNFELPDVPYIKNWFGTRIMYSDIHINDAYKNGFRVFRGQNYRDYTREYGSIVKLVSFESSLLCVFEHGIALIPVNERAIAGQGAGGNVYINTSNVLPENPKIISDMFGSQWPESILKVPGRTGDAPQYVYGVDTVAKKIWRTDGNILECISDFKVQEFLNNNITLGERELTPIIGIRNVKTLYNAHIRDVMFTFYDNTYGFEEKVWNLCWNELLQKFITFYSWVPSYMENINNVPFSFDRNVSKWIAKLGTSHSECSFADGITLTNVLLNIEDDTYTVDNYNVTISYVTKSGETKTHTESIPTGSRKNLVGALQLNSNTLPNSNMFYNVHFELQPDVFGNYKEFYIPPKEEPIMEVSLPDDALFAGKTIKIYGLYFNDAKASLDYVYYKDQEGLLQEVKDNKSQNVCVKSNSLCSELYYRNNAGHAYADYDTNRIGGDGNLYFDKPIFKNIEGKRPMLPRNLQINPNKLVSLLNIRATIEIEDDNNQHIKDMGDVYYNNKAGYIAGYYESAVAITPKWNLQFLTSDFWKHGQAGIIDITDDIKPTYWYGKRHPFEFEVVVVNDPSVHKIFSNLELVANKAKPESFHYEIIGESFDFAKDKPNMYFRQEARKALWQYNGADICYNRNFLKVQTKQQPKSADFPHRYYSRQDTINDIEDYYYTRTLSDYDVNNSNSLAYSYKHLAGAEIVYYPNRQEFRIWNHVPAVSKDDLLDNTAEYWIKQNGITTYVNDTDRNYTNKDPNRPYRQPYSGGRSIIGANCEYLEDRWRVQINPIIVCYKNEYKREYSGYRLDPDNTTWPWNSTNTSRLPSIPVFNSPVPDIIMQETNGEITYPFKWKENGTLVEDPCTDKNNALYGLYHPSSEEHWDMLDGTNWLNDVNIYRTNFVEAQNRKELDLKDKFMKVRIRYSGEELAVIDFLNTIYRISYA